MRIEAYTQVQQLYQSQKVSRTQKTQTASHTDRLQISSQGKDFQTAKAAVAAAPDIREELTAPIKARIQNGTYGVDNASFAEKLLQKQEEMRTERVRSTKLCFSYHSARHRLLQAVILQSYKRSRTRSRSWSAGSTIWTSRERE